MHEEGLVGGATGGVTEMTANKPRWPECGCLERCDKRKCRTVGSRALQASRAKPGSSIKAAQLGLVTRKYAPQELKLVIKLAADTPVESVIAHRAGISTNALRYWNILSREGYPGDPFDIKLEDGRTERFHILFEDAIEEGFDKVEQVAYEMATGTAREVLDYQGKVCCKKDPFLLELGLTGDAANLLDKSGDPIPETKPFVDPEMVRFMLSRHRPDPYGNRPKASHEQKGGVLVLGPPMNSAELEKAYGGTQKLVDVEFEKLPPPDDGKRQSER
jgi:hypothetical protein